MPMKQIMDALVIRMLQRSILQEELDYQFFCMMRNKYFDNSAKWVTDRQSYQKLLIYWNLMRPFDTRAEVALVHRPSLYDKEAKNFSKLWLEVPVFAWIKREEQRHQYIDEECTAVLAWSFYRAFNRHRLHKNMGHFLSEIRRPYKLFIVDKQLISVARKLLLWLEEYYPFFRQLYKIFFNKKASVKPKFEEWKRLLIYLLTIMPLPVRVLEAILVLPQTNYLSRLLRIIKIHWSYLRTLKPRQRIIYYVHSVLNRHQLRGLSSFVLGVLPETNHSFREFLIDLKLAYFRK